MCITAPLYIMPHTGTLCISAYQMCGWSLGWKHLSDYQGAGLGFVTMSFSFVTRPQGNYKSIIIGWEHLSDCRDFVTRLICPRKIIKILFTSPPLLLVVLMPFPVYIRDRNHSVYLTSFPSPVCSFQNTRGFSQYPGSDRFELTNKNLLGCKS